MDTRRASEGVDFLPKVQDSVWPPVALSCVLAQAASVEGVDKNL